MARHIPLSQGARFQMGGGDSRRLVSPEDGAEQLTLNYSAFEPGHEFPQHIHDSSADIFIVLQGGVSVRQGDAYVPIRAGDFAYIPPGEVHGTVNQTGDRAVLISFQSPPDPSLYSGERDPSVTGSVPRPPENHVTTVQIRQLTSGEPEPFDGGVRWTPASPHTGAKEMVLWYVEMEPDGTFATEPEPDSETVWFVREGQAECQSGEDTFVADASSAVYVSPVESLTIRNGGGGPLHLIRCKAIPPS